MLWCGEVNQSHTCYSVPFPSLVSLECGIIISFLFFFFIISLVCPFERKTRVISADAWFERIIVPHQKA